MNFSITTLPYLNDSHRLLCTLKPLSNMVALESSNFDHPEGRWSIISAAPNELIKLEHKHDFKSAIRNLNSLRDKLPSIESTLPFTGGLIGHISYDLGISDSPQASMPNYRSQPFLLCGLYTWAYLIDHHLKQSYLVHWSEVSEHSKEFLVSLFNNSLGSSQSHLNNFKLSTPFKALWNKGQYKIKIERILDYILSGDTYQVNLAQSFKATYTGSPLEAYTKIKARAKVPFASYFESGNWCFASASPELFLRCSNNEVITKPIKGTRPRHSDPVKDEQERSELMQSTKDRAENLMIVDLLRNDLSKNSQNIKVDELFAIESFSTVHHLVSTIAADISGKDPVKLLMDAFPGGSITGAPKKRSMEIISELEQVPRSFYCGSSFYFSSNNMMSSNILIRGFLFENNEVTCWAGGGIVADSKWEDEYQESLDKISKLMQAIS